MKRLTPVLFAFAIAALGYSQARVTSPKAHFGFDVGDDYQLANYTQYSAYLKKLDAESDRITVVSIGKSEEGRDQWMAIISSPQNLRNVERLRKLSVQLARGDAPTEAEARRLSAEGKAVVWIDGGLHATEVLGAQQLIETAYRLVSRDDPETTRIRNDVIVLLAHANPDGMELVSDWYMRRTDPQQRSMGGVPRLYEKYAGHDNNRDFYMCNLSESTNINRVMYRDWCPQVLYNHHQTAPAGSIIFVPPFRGPFNYHVDPLVQVQTDLAGMAMHQRFVAEGKPGAVMRNAASYQTWWNGGLRTTAYFHNVIGILTEAFGSPTPTAVPYVQAKMVPTTDNPFPIEPQPWKFRQSIEYELTANYALLDFASRNRENLLFNMWRMARNAIDKAGQDTWTYYPGRVENNRGGIGNLKRPEMRDAKGYILPADQPDFPTAVKFVNTLIKNGVEVHRATSGFRVAGKSYPEGSLIVKCAQAYRSHVLDMFEPQDYPNDFQYPGGPPIPPYDSAGYTLAFTMGVQFDRILDPFDGPFQKIEEMAPAPSIGVNLPRGSSPSYVIDGRKNDAFAVVAGVLAAGGTVRRIGSGSAGRAHVDAGAFVVSVSGPAEQTFIDLCKRFGVPFDFVREAPPEANVSVKSPRIALLDRYGGSMPSGWTRLILEQFGLPFTVVYPPDLDSGNLKERFDLLILVDGMTFGGGGGRGGGDGGDAPLTAVEGKSSPRPLARRDGLPQEERLQEERLHKGELQEEGPQEGAQTSLSAPRSAGILACPRETPNLEPLSTFLQGGQGNLAQDPTIPEEWRKRMGNLTSDTLAKVKEFLEAGGRVLAIGSATNIGRQLGLPIGSALTETVDGRERNLPRDKFFCPGSVLRARVDSSLPVAWGMPDYVDMMSDNSPAFKLLDGAEAAGIKKVAWYDTDKPLRSGWCWGQSYLKDSVAALQAPMGKGTLYLFGTEILFRGQTHASFKFLFNAAFGG